MLVETKRHGEVEATAVWSPRGSCWSVRGEKPWKSGGRFRVEASGDTIEEAATAFAQRYDTAKPYRKRGADWRKGLMEGVPHIVDQDVFIACAVEVGAAQFVRSSTVKPTRVGSKPPEMLPGVEVLGTVRTGRWTLQVVEWFPANKGGHIDMSSSVVEKLRRCGVALSFAHRAGNID